MPLEDAVYKLTGLPAQILVTDRGVLQEGAAADVTRFQPDRVADRSEYTDSVKKPAGIPHVLVGGQPAGMGTERPLAPEREVCSSKHERGERTTPWMTELEA